MTTPTEIRDYLVGMYPKGETLGVLAVLSRTEIREVTLEEMFRLESLV